MTATNQELEKLLKTYPAGVSDMALQTRQFVITALPGIQETVDAG